jgi:SAM-dependent methyltransferase
MEINIDKLILDTKNNLSEILSDNYNYLDDYFLYHKNRYSIILDRFSHENISPAARILDVGAAPYHLTVMLKKIGCKIDATNLVSGEYEEIIERYYDIKIINNDLEHAKFPFQYNFFDYLLFSETVEHLNFNCENLFKEFYRILKPGGKIFITTPNLVRLNNRLKLLIGKSTNFNIEKAFFSHIHFREYTASEIIYILKIAGFEIKKLSYINFDYPDMNSLVKVVGKLIGVFIPSTKSNLIIIAEKKL